MNEYTGPERRAQGRLTEEEMAALAQRIKELIMEDIYGEIGKAVLKRLAAAVVTGGAIIVAWIGGKEGWFK